MGYILASNRYRGIKWVVLSSSDGLLCRLELSCTMRELTHVNQPRVRGSKGDVETKGRACRIAKIGVQKKAAPQVTKKDALLQMMIGCRIT